MSFAQNKVVGMPKQRLLAYRFLTIVSNQFLVVMCRLETLNIQAIYTGRIPYVSEKSQTSSLSCYTASCLFLIYIDITTNIRK